MNVLCSPQKNIAMCPLNVKGAILFLFLHAVISFGEQNLNSNADIINTCVDTTWCSHSYEQVYKSLAKAENNFNISHALYPGRSRPPSVRVLVSVFGSHKTDACITPAVYTWSMSCLFVSVPAAVLEFLSLGSILVTPRTQELIVHIPQFCCRRVPVDYFPLQYSGLFTAPAVDLELAILLYVRCKQSLIPRRLLFSKHFCSMFETEKLQLNEIV